MISETPVGVEPGGRADTQRGPAAPPRSDPERSGTGGPAALGASSSGAVLRFLTAALRAKAVVDIRTGSGDNARCLLDGMQPDGVLTSIDVDPNAQREARRQLSEAGIGSGRARLISGMAQDVLPRLAEGAYDLVFFDDRESEYPNYLRLGLRLLRPGGVVAFARVRAPAPETSADALRELHQLIEDDESLVPTVLPVGSGLLAVARG